MVRIRWDRPDAFDHVVLVGGGDARLRAAMEERLGRVPGVDPGGRARERHPRFKVIAVASAPMVRRKCAANVSAAAIDLAIRGSSGLDLIRELREARPELPILAFARGAPASEAIAAVMAGADFFHDCTDPGCAGLERALEHAIDRRRLAALDLFRADLDRKQSIQPKLLADCADLVLSSTRDEGRWNSGCVKRVQELQDARNRMVGLHPFGCIHLFQHRPPLCDAQQWE